MDYQHLFAMSLSELGKTSLVQHDIKLDDLTLFKEHDQRIPQHQYEEVKKYLQEMIEIGAICKSTSLWEVPSFWYAKSMETYVFVLILESLTTEQSRMCRVYLE